MSGNSQRYSTVNAIQSRGLTKVFSGQTVLRDINMEIAESECVALTGANGSGKTTLLRCLCGSIRPTAGTVVAYGREPRTNLQARRQIGYVAHTPQVYPHLTTRENLVFAARMTAVPEPVRRADELLDEIGLRRSADQLPSSISRGMNQRLAIARAVVHDPQIILLDEPFTGLDRQGEDWLAHWIEHQVQFERAVCFATHSEARSRLAQRVLRLHEGELHQREPQLACRKNLSHGFLRAVRGDCA